MENPLIIDNRVQHLLNHLQDGIFITDEKGVAIWANDKSTKQLGVPRAEILGKHVEELENNGLFTPSVTRIVMERREVVTKVQTSKGRQHLATGFLVTVPEDDAEYILVQVKDITETVRASFRLEKAESLLQKYVEELHHLRQKEKKQQKEKVIIGNSKRHEEMVDLINRVAPVDTTLLLNGETGVGKSVIAKEIHELSNRAGGPFLQINCGAIPDNLLESELFGYAKGAFTGASNKGKTGLAEKAHGGTLFLDEIAELPLVLQPKILQLVQDKSFIPVGGTELKEVNIRIIAATNQNLAQMVEEKTFREDLYYRLNVVMIQIPSLKDRSEDIPSLIYHYFERFKKQYNKALTLDKNLLHHLQHYEWPGNVRELENLLEFLVVTATSDVIGMDALPAKNLHQKEWKVENSVHERPSSQPLQEYLNDIERDVIEQAKQEYSSTRKAAEALGMTQSSYVRRLRKYGL